jgi:DNA-binding LacI/PurR family transcriptional regulator
LNVAQQAGVSQSTVSRVFSAPDAVAEETVQQVRKVAQQLGYKPNAIARSLSNRRTDMIGILMSEITSPFYPYVLEKFSQRLHKLGKRVLLFTTSPQEDTDSVLQHALQYQVDGLILANITLSSAVVRESLKYKTPLVLFNRYVKGVQARSVTCDNVAGGHIVADALLDSGHKGLAYIAGRPEASTHVDREAGFISRLAERGYTGVLREQGYYTYESGYEACRRLLKLTSPPDAIFCANDITAMGAIDAARDLGVKIPEHLSIIGFDDIPAAAWSAYSLTTVRQPVNHMVEASVAMLLESIERPTTKPVAQVIPGELVRRGSARLTTTLG